MGWARKVDRELCRKWECRQEGLNQGCACVEGEERATRQLPEPGDWADAGLQGSLGKW